ncbi:MULTISPECIES: hypothetical protein [unclassified Streptomyces]|uniref:hypothetical protein n=1 Tax=unclassified Streptomyces TaxID=2593676 RepID=UPI000C272B13|nr:hypothetical protein [Streptomyces sp. CB01373]PJM97451.1 hypothetical protein CG719_00625 [Streptomyces sp. CB01373]
MHTRILLTTALLTAVIQPSPSPSASAPITPVEGSGTPNAAETGQGTSAMTHARRSPDAVPSSRDAEPPPTRALAAADLTISVPATANLGAASAGSTHSAQLGTVTVTGQQEPEWTVTVTATALTTTGGTIPTGDIAYWSGPATAESSPGTCSPGQSGAGSQVTLNAARTAFSYSGSNGNESCSWNPTVVITVPANAPVGLYVGTVTHSVA